MPYRIWLDSRESSGAEKRQVAPSVASPSRACTVHGTKVLSRLFSKSFDSTTSKRCTGGGESDGESECNFLSIEASIGCRHEPIDGPRAVSIRFSLGCMAFVFQKPRQCWLPTVSDKAWSSPQARHRVEHHVEQNSSRGHLESMYKCLVSVSVIPVSVSGLSLYFEVKGRIECLWTSACCWSTSMFAQMDENVGFKLVGMKHDGIIGVLWGVVGRMRQAFR